MAFVKPIREKGIVISKTYREAKEYKAIKSEYVTSLLERARQNFNKSK